MDCFPQIHTIAIHAEAGYKSVVPGIGILCRGGDALVGIGVFSNSVGQHSDYAVIGYQPWHTAGLRIGAVVGLTDGYPLRNGGVIPMAAGVISWGNTHVTIIPPIRNVSPLTFQSSFTLQ